MSVFQPPPRAHFRGYSLATSVAVHLAAACCLMLVPLTVGDRPATQRDRTPVRLVTPPAPLASRPRLARTPPLPSPVPAPARPRLAFQSFEPRTPKPETRFTEPPQIALAAPAAEPILQPAPELAPAPRQPAKLGVFTDLREVERTAREPRMIAEAGFATGSASRSEDFAPRRGIVASAGFAASSVPGQRARAPGAPVRQVGFSYAPAAAEKRTTPVRDAGFNVAIESAEKRRPAAAAQAAFEPVEILSKPRPAYTAEARAARIEGAVELEILFGASGELRVLRVVRGLGSGLNESAIEAARQIRFKPATRDGVPADFTALVQVIFQMVY